MSKNIQFNIDKTKVKTGEYVTVTWQCEGPDAVSLTIDNGSSTNSLQLPDSGSRSIVMEKGKTTLRLKAIFNGKAEQKELTVKVEEPKAAKKPRARKATSRRLRSPKELWYGFKAGWNMLPEKRRRVLKTLIYVTLALWFFSIIRTCGYQDGYQKGIESSTQYSTQTV